MAHTKAVKGKIRASVSSRIFDVLNYSLMVFFCVSIIFPIWEMVVMSFSPPSAVSHLSLNLWPTEVTLDSYRYCLDNSALWTAFKNSILRTAIGSAYHLIVCSLAAFSLTRTNMPFKGFFTVTFLITMFFSGGMIPTYLNMKDLGLLNNFFVYILPGGFSIYNTIIIRNYFFSIDKSLEEAAMIDGASAMQTLWRIILPLSKPVLATVGLWQMVGQWNSWYDNMVYCRSESLVTLQWLLKKMSLEVMYLQNDLNQYAELLGYRFEVVSDTVIAATTVIVVLPIVCVYPFLQKYFVKGVMLGAVKG